MEKKITKEPKIIIKKKRVPEELIEPTVKPFPGDIGPIEENWFERFGNRILDSVESLAIVGEVRGYKHERKLNGVGVVLLLILAMPLILLIFVSMIIILVYAFLISFVFGYPIKKERTSC